MPRVCVCMWRRVKREQRGAWQRGGGPLDRYPVITQALPVRKHSHPGFWGGLLRARLEDCPVKGKRPWTWTQEPQRAGNASSPGRRFPSVKICVPAGVAGTWGGREANPQKVGSFSLPWPLWGLVRDGASSAGPRSQPLPESSWQGMGVKGSTLFQPPTSLIPPFPTGPGKAAAEVSYFPPAELATTEPKAQISRTKECAWAHTHSYTHAKQTRAVRLLFTQGNTPQ